MLKLRFFVLGGVSASNDAKNFKFWSQLGRFFVHQKIPILTRKLSFSKYSKVPNLYVPRLRAKLPPNGVKLPSADSEDF